MQPPFVDLHTHTTASDGSETPARLMELAARARLRTVAVTDHDTLAGLAEAEDAGRALGIEVIRGCELSATSEYGEVHLLGLWLPRDCPALEAALARLRAARAARNAQILEKLAALGLPLDMDEVLAQSGGESVGRPHIALAMRARGYIRETGDAFRLFIGQKGPAFVPRAAFAPEEAVRLLVSAGATVAFAHPMLLNCPPDWREALAARLAGIGLDAIEAYHSEHTARDEHDCVALAARLGLGLTGGSDFHGVAKPRIALGRGKGGLRVTAAVLDALKARRLARGLPV